MFCNYCCSQNPEDALYCCRCGRKTQVGGSAPEQSAGSATDGSPNSVKPLPQHKGIAAYGWLFVLAGIFLIFGGLLMESLLAVVQGLLFGATGAAILNMSSVAVPLVWSNTVLTGVGVVARGIAPLDLLLWLASLGVAIWYTKKHKVPSVDESLVEETERQPEIWEPREHSKSPMAEAGGANSVRQVAIAIASVIVLLFGWLVWPTPHRYDLFNGRFPFRTNRLTGEVERLGSQGWTKVASDQPVPASQSAAPKQPLPTCASLGGRYLERLANREAGKCRDPLSNFGQRQSTQESSP